MAKDMLGKVVRKIVTISEEQLAILCDLSEKLGGPNGEEWFNEGKLFLRKEPCWLVPPPIPQTDYLRPISGNEWLTIDACDGTEILAEATDVFTAGIDSDFRNWKADEKGKATPEAKVAVYELIKNGAFKQMFDISPDTSKLCLTQAQIKGFVVRHRKWLREDGYATFFLFKSHSEFFFASVGVGSGVSLYVNVHRFLGDRDWCAERGYRVVILQLA